MRGICPALLLVVAGLASPETDRDLFDNHRWFELRQREPSSALHRGAVASAFGQTAEAERYLRRAVRTDAQQAHTALMFHYMRLGRMRAGLTEAERVYALPGKADGIRDVRALLTALARYPDQSIAGSRRLRTRWCTKQGGFTVPVSVNGRMVQWIFDTGFNLSGISEAEAKMLGVDVMDVRASASDSAGGSTPVRAAVIPKLTIGGVTIRNVSFLVIPDSQPPMNELQPTERGIVGLPVILALQTVRWTSDGVLEAGFPFPRTRSEPNLCFDGLTPILRAQFAGKNLDFLFDTGNDGGTDLWERFAKDFPLLLQEKGSKSTKEIGGIGGTNVREATVLPEITIRIGGLDTLLKPARVLPRPVGNDLHHGLLGMDLLHQAREVMLDFRNMIVALK